MSRGAAELPLSAAKQAWARSTRQGRDHIRAKGMKRLMVSAIGRSALCRCWMPPSGGYLLEGGGCVWQGQTRKNLFREGVSPPRETGLGLVACKQSNKTRDTIAQNRPPLASTRATAISASVIGANQPPMISTSCVLESQISGTGLVL